MLILTDQITDSGNALKKDVKDVQNKSPEVKTDEGCEITEEKISYKSISDFWLESVLKTGYLVCFSSCF